jgi:hypothetical protein
MQQPPRPDWRNETSMRPIVRPGASKSSIGMLAKPNVITGIGLVLLPVVVAIVAGVAAVATGSAVAAVAVIAAAVLACIPALRHLQRDVVSGPGWQIEGKPIDGQGFQLLADIDSRFAYAESNIKKLPTGITWDEIADDTRALLWEAAQHGAAITALDTEIHELRYAEPGTPQAALKASVEARRSQHWNLMRAIQWEAETLARTAGNAVAAAHVALARTGSLAALDEVLPSREAIVAAGALSAARDRLEILTSVWTGLDDSGTLVAEKLDAERRQLEGGA